MSLQEFLTMGKHGFYVWWSYGLTLLTIVLLFAGFAWYKKQLLKKVTSLAKQKTVKARTVQTEIIKD